jgi:hypothetical protein
MAINNSIPQSVKVTLWSYDTDKVDIISDKKLIISQVLNYGTKEATDWLFQTYSKEEIAQEAASIPTGQWDKKSLALWSLYLGITPQSRMSRILYGQ